MVTDAMLARHRATQARYMPDSCVIQRRTFGARNQFAERSETWPTVATVACRIAAAGAPGDPAVTNARVLTTIGEFDLTVPYDTDIRGGDRLIRDGVTYEVTGEPIAGTYASAKRAALSRLERD